MITRTHESKKGIMLTTIGTLLMYLYIFFSYVAQDIVISSRVASLSLYAFISFTLLKEIANLNFARKFSAFSIWYFLFAAFSLLIMSYAPERNILSGAFYSIIVTFVVIWAVQTYVIDANAFRSLAWCFAISGCATFFLLLVTGNLKGSAEERLGQEFFGNANTFAALMMVAALFAVWLIVFSHGFHRFAAIAILAVSLYTLALSSGRKFFIIPFLFLYILLLCNHDKKGRTHFIRNTIIFLILIWIVWLAITKIPVFYNAIGIRMEGFFETLEGEGGEASAQIREEMRALAMEGWKERPLFGYGLDSFKHYAVTEMGIFAYSHCNYTELLYSGGFIYFILYYAMFANIILRARKKKLLATPFRAFAIALPITLFIFDFGAVSYNTPFQLILLALAYKALSLKTKEEINNGID